MKDAIEQIEELIQDTKCLITYEGRVLSNTPLYEGYYKRLETFIYQFNLSNTEEFKKISENLIYTSIEFLTNRECDIILVNLQNLKRKILKNFYSPENYFWNYINKSIVDSSKSLFDNQHYAEAVFKAFKTINIEVKKLYLDIAEEEKDGYDLMSNAFSSNNPKIFLTKMVTQSEKDEQKGYMHLFQGAMSAIKNPKSHENDEISKEKAIHLLTFASLLMNKLNGRVTSQLIA